MSLLSNVKKVFFYFKDPDLTAHFAADIYLESEEIFI
jgi:hypothetical protein